MIYLLPPWGVHLGNRLVKNPKAYLVDTGLLTHPLGINEQRLQIDPTLIGALFENFIVSQLKKQVDLYHNGTAVD